MYKLSGVTKNYAKGREPAHRADRAGSRSLRRRWRAAGNSAAGGHLIRRPDGPGWTPQDPVILSGPGQAEFDLTPVPAGDHVMALIAWAPDATAKPVSVTLPSVTIRQGTR